MPARLPVDDQGLTELDRQLLGLAFAALRRGVHPIDVVIAGLGVASCIANNHLRTMRPVLVRMFADAVFLKDPDTLADILRRDRDMGQQS